MLWASPNHWSEITVTNNNEKVLNIPRNTKRWHRDTKWGNAVRKIVLIDLLETGLPNLQFIKRTQNLQSAIKQSTIKWGMLVYQFEEAYLQKWLISTPKVII